MRLKKRERTAESTQLAQKELVENSNETLPELKLKQEVISIELQRMKWQYFLH